MQLICDGVSLKRDVMEESLTQYKEVFIKAKREWDKIVQVRRALLVKSLRVSLSADQPLLLITERHQVHPSSSWRRRRRRRRWRSRFVLLFLSHRSFSKPVADRRVLSLQAVEETTTWTKTIPTTAMTTEEVVEEHEEEELEEPEEEEPHPVREVEDVELLLPEREELLLV